MTQRPIESRPDKKPGENGPDRLSGPASVRPGKNADSHEKITFRKNQRNAFSDFWFRFTRAVKTVDLLPFAIVFSGTIFAYFMAEPSLTVALITLMTASLCGCAIYVKSWLDFQKRSGSAALHERFEKLEDRAWELHESEERYRILAEAFGDILLMRDANGDVVFSNDAYDRLVDEIPAVLKNAKDSTRPLPEFLPEFLVEQLKEPLAGNAIGQIQFETKMGPRWLQWEDVPVRDGKNGGMGVLSVARDISAFKQSQKLDAEARHRAEQASKAKSKFLAMVSHEMRTPLNGIIGMSKLLANTKLDGEQQNYTNALTNSGEHLLELINSMLDLTMIEAGRFEAKTESVDFADFMNRSVELLSSRAYAKNIDCGLFIDPGLPHSLTLDAGRLRQIVFNLVGNAIKFTSNGGVMVRCVAKTDQVKKGLILRIEVNDTGPGLDPENFTRIFREFERVDDDVTRKTDGAGLGLSISRALAHELGGLLELTRSDEKGSQFVLELPIVKTLEESGESIEAAQDDLQSLANHRVLIVSDNKNEANCIAETICSLGGDVKTVDSCLAALKKAANTSPEFTEILFDIAADKRQRQLAFEIKNLFGEETRLVMLSLPQSKNELRYYQQAMDGWLIRPVRRDSLISVLTDNTAKPDKFSRTDEPDLSRAFAHRNSKGSVLLAEDNDINALLVTAALKRAGIEVERVSNGKEAVASFNKRFDRSDGSGFDVVLMDMHMPVLDGLEAIRQIRSIERQNNSLPAPIFALTADEQSDTRTDADKAGVNGFLTKPVDPDQLCKLVMNNMPNSVISTKAG